MVEKSQWTKMVEANPEHSTWFVNRFRAMAAAGQDVEGEARFVDAMVPRQSRLLDAGCGSGRVGAALARSGHEVVGVDVDPVLIEAALEDHPGPTWLVGDLAELDLPSRGIPGDFDAVVAAGNVVPFLAPSTRVEVLDRMRRHVKPSGRVVVGFGAGRGYVFEDFLDDARAAELEVDLLLSGWDVRPFRADSDFLVAILRPA
jgi:SAM-dependent methyltransferase